MMKHGQEMRSEAAAARSSSASAKAPTSSAHTESEIAQSAEVHTAVEHGPQATATAVAEQGFRGTPQALPFQTEMESRFGQHFDHVQAFRGGPAREASGYLNANAYAVGDRVAFRDESPSRFVVAHELAHTIQQGGGSGPVVQALSADAGGEHETEANSAAEAVLRGEQAHVELSAPVGIQRDGLGDLISGLGTLFRRNPQKRAARTVNQSLQALNSDEIEKGPAMADMLDAWEGLGDPFAVWNRVPPDTRRVPDLEETFMEAMAVERQAVDLGQQLAQRAGQSTLAYYELLKKPIYANYERNAKKVLRERMQGEDRGPGGLGGHAIVQEFVTAATADIQAAWTQPDETRGLERLRTGLMTSMQTVLAKAGKGGVVIRYNDTLNTGERARFQGGVVNLSSTYAQDLIQSPDDLSKAREIIKAVIHESKHYEQTPEKMLRDYGPEWAEQRDPEDAGALAAAIEPLKTALGRAVGLARLEATQGGGSVRGNLIRRLREEGIDQAWTWLDHIENGLLNGTIKQAEDDVKAAYTRYRENADEWDAFLVGDLAALVFDIQQGLT